ncbi:MAG: Tetratricopeptide 2 repeat-containing protein [Chthonomonadaceae bacterium]|nr:Tetratricopeptide 2 repeat-containing protein [Chthonomonadaceae bacterium]
MSAETDAGLTALQSGDINGAIAQLERAIAADPTDYQAHQYLGAAYGQAGRQMEAVTTLTQAVTLQPSNAQARYNLAVAYESAGYKEQALVAAQQALQLQPDYPRAQEAVARLSGQPPTPPAYTPPAAPQYGQPQQPAQQPYGQPDQPPAYGQPAQTQQPYGQPAAPQYGQPQQQPYQNQGAAAYGGPPSNAYTPPNAMQMMPQASKEANDALILAIVSIFCCGIILAPIALVKANAAKRIIAENPGMTGEGKAQAAMIISIIALILSVIGVFRIIAMATAISSGMPH